jgi:hypothetical protein
VTALSVQASRARWVRIGNGLAAGRRMYASDKLYGQWIKTTPYSRLHATTRKNALWFGQLLGCDSLVDLPDDLGHPTSIREWFRDLQASQDTPPLSTDETAVNAVLVNAVKVAGKERGILAKAEHAKVDSPEGRAHKRRGRRVTGSSDKTHPRKDDPIPAPPTGRRHAAEDAPQALSDRKHPQ